MKKTIVKTYKGKSNVANRKFKTDAQRMAKKNYYPTTQNYTPGSWGCGSFLVALLLCLVLVGILIFFYMLIVKPDGTLVVTYVYREETEES